MSEKWQYWDFVYQLLKEVGETLDTVEDDDGDFDISVSVSQVRQLRITALILKTELFNEPDPEDVARFKGLWRAEISASNSMVRFLAVDVMQQAERHFEELGEIPF